MSTILTKKYLDNLVNDRQSKTVEEQIKFINRKLIEAAEEGYKTIILDYSFLYDETKHKIKEAGLSINIKTLEDGYPYYIISWAD